MIIKFNEAASTRKPTFGDVKVNQFFVDQEDYLCQKTTDISYNVIAGEKGSPFSDHESPVDPLMEVTRILPEVTKIEF